jgi:uncharacterized membrane protein YbhN (UPF0104 family)
MTRGQLSDVPSGGVALSAEGSRSRALLVAGVIGGLAAAALAAVIADPNGRALLMDSLDSTADLGGRIRWPIAAVVLALSAAHYLAAAVAARAASGADTPLRERVLVQLSAATANRLTFGGLGGSALQIRYLVRRCGYGVPIALGAISTLTVLGAVADLLILLFLLVSGRWVGLGGGSTEVAALLGRVGSLVQSVGSSWIWLAAAAAAAVALAVFLRRRTRWTRGFFTPFVRLGRRPRSLATLMGASGSTTLILGFAFAASASVLPGAQPRISIGGLVIAYMLAAAAAGAVPVPAGLGAAEATMTAALVTAGVPAGHALADVLVFRVITFWLPALVGLLAARQLRRVGAL